ncbi:uncharacterized protein LOC143770494 isoform X2 [Ranitomeya variabilis]|uniref:uncharacterized protein LOC143770494 isoform X2 n=1 Tax=Ranitomeya variabilis TaxID=490064 RepID=UPI004057A3EB
MAVWRQLAFLQLGILVYLSTAQEDEMIPIPHHVDCHDPHKIFCPLRICYNNCDNMNSTTEACIKPLWYGCECIDGYVYQSATSNICVPLSCCTINCGPNMHFVPCLKAYRKTCATRNKPPVKVKGCLPRCVCNDGYILSDDPVPVCIKKWKCHLFGLVKASDGQISRN